MKTNKRIQFLLLLLLCCVTGRMHAQTFDEWFRQSATQKKYLIDQIIALKTYSTYARKGYKIIRDGNGLISAIKNNDLNLHQAFFDDRRKVKTIIRDSDKVKEVVQLHQMTIKNMKQLVITAAKSVMITGSELNELKTIQENLIADCEHDADELELVLTDGEVSMSDDERIHIIDQLYKDALRKNSYSVRLQKQTTELIAARKKILKDKEGLKALYK